eukprot:4501189-Pyramimonas_sp.AAC.1
MDAIISERRCPLSQPAGCAATVDAARSCLLLAPRRLHRSEPMLGPTATHVQSHQHRQVAGRGRPQ